MSTLRQSIAQAIKRKSGEIFWVKKTLTSSGITTAAQNLTGAATGQIEILNVICKTDATGLAGGTNFVISSTNAKGTVNIAVETVANLGANITKSFGNPPAGDTTTSDAGYTVTSTITVLEPGAKVQYNTTASGGTGAGTIDVFLECIRIDEGAVLSNA